MLVSLLSSVLFFIGFILIAGGLLLLLFAYKIKNEADSSQYD
jgi:uncharacterized membrane protein